jgi:putative DNA methylase
MISSVIPFSLKDAPALIESLLPVQKLSAEAYKEQEGKQGKILTTLGSYWKGRKPLVVSKACVLGCLLPATKNLKRDLEVFEQLMAMDDESLAARWPRRPSPKEILARVGLTRIEEYFIVEPTELLPRSSPIDWSKPEFEGIEAKWREDVSELERRRIEARMLPVKPYKELVELAKRPDEVGASVHEHIWTSVNDHLGTQSFSFPELIEQLGIMRFGHRPLFADSFSGSGQIPFEAARLGCNAYASDLNPVACMLTWGAFEVIGGLRGFCQRFQTAQERLVHEVQADIDAMCIETDGAGWVPKSFLYCIEVHCPQTGWRVPLLPSRLISKGKRAFAELVPDFDSKVFKIEIRSGASEAELGQADTGTVRTDGRGQEPYLAYHLNGIDYRTKISTLRGDFKNADGTVGNKLRAWDKSEFQPRPDDIFQERLYGIHWMLPKKRGSGFEYEFRSVTNADLLREQVVEEFLAQNLTKWQEEGWIPDMRVEPGVETERLARERGWTHWHHLFAPRQLLFLGLTSRHIRERGDDLTAPLLIFLARLCDWSSKLCRYGTGAARESVAQTFYNQALNTLLTYGVRSFSFAKTYLLEELSEYPLEVDTRVECRAASESAMRPDLYVTDPPYGDAVKYEEILEFFIAWLRKKPPPEFSDWIWDSRRSLAIKGEGESFRRSMVAAYKRMTECMPDNGIQVIMFTHQSGSIWADMANIVWASGLHVTAAWYVVTETDSALREGSYVKGTVLLVLRKRGGVHKTSRDDLAWEIQEEVQSQVHSLTGLNQEAKGLYRDENVFEDADIQMAGYAAALRVLTRYAIIDGRDMTFEAVRPRMKGEETFVDGLIKFAVDTANRCLVPQGIAKDHWDVLGGAERFYLKLLDLETKGLKTLDNYQNFAKAFKVLDFRPLLASQKANQARLKSAVEFGKNEMSEGSELHQSVLRAVLYAMMELVKSVDGNEVLTHLTFNVPDYYQNQQQRELAAELSDYFAKKLETLRPEEASAARVLRDLVRNQRLG